MPIIEPWPQLQNHWQWDAPTLYQPICSAGRSQYLRDVQPPFHFSPGQEFQFHAGEWTECQICAWLYR